jgi:chemotaxis protein methyltransferase CheR
MSTALARKDEAGALVNGEFPFTQDDFQRIAGRLHQIAGIALPSTKATLVYSRLAKRLRLLGIPSFTAYCQLVESPEGEQEQLAMLAALTTNVTRFFREGHHFDHLRTQVVEPLAAAVRAGRRLRIWSAGCSTGQEPYSIALTILKVLPEAPRLDVKILATDIDPNVVATARRAQYPQDQVDEIPAAMKGAYLERGESGWRFNAAVRDMVTVNELNLMGEWPMRGAFDAIFCRNVVIYFDEPTQARIWGRFAPRLGPGGRLYVGHSERAAYPNSVLETDGLTTYRAPGVLA